MAVSFGPTTGSKSAGDILRDRRAIATWLFTMCGMVFAMVVIGGITRLTESGLSMVEWRALHDTFPPLSEAEWQRQFALYQRTPEFQVKNFWMTVDDFKTIYWWEWIHRTWGRLIGIVFIVPFLWFLVKGRVERALLPRLVFLLFLGGLQGGIGWWMVKSGLVDQPDVSQYRLAVHLTMAFVIQAFLFWTALDLWRGTFASGQPVRRRPMALSLLILFVVVSGAFVAGTDAGYIYNTFPLMNGRGRSGDLLGVGGRPRQLGGKPVGDPVQPSAGGVPHLRSHSRSRDRGHPPAGLAPATPGGDCPRPHGRDPGRAGHLDIDGDGAGLARYRPLYRFRGQPPGRGLRALHPSALAHPSLAR